MRAVPIEKVSHYCCEDIDYTIRLKNLFEKELEARQMTPLLQELEIPLLVVLAKMERHGIFLDIPNLKEFSIELKTMIQLLEKDIYFMAG